jgi:allophanate hydrolase
MNISALHALYRARQLTPTALVEQTYGKISQLAPIWISLVSKEEALAQASALEAREMNKLPLYGIPFAVKDNIDVAGLPTTAGCAAFAYTPVQSSPVVDSLLQAGAILIGKTNLDQFATGLVGTRTPYGICASVFDDKYISGGSSAGSAVAVAKGLVSFALGTDTAGSGRVPAAFNGVVGLKPTPGLLSTTGVVPACRTLDCVSILAETCADAALVFDIARGYDALDPYSRDLELTTYDFGTSHGVLFGVPQDGQLEFFGDEESAAAYAQTVAALEAFGGEKIYIDLAPFRAAAELLYSGPWVAERLAALGSFVQDHGAEMNATVRAIISGADRYTATDAFKAAYRLEELRRQTSKVWDEIDVLLLPTVPRTYTIAEVEQAPIELNNRLGYYTNFVNLLDLAAVAVPAGIKASGLPFGASLIAPAGTDFALLQLGDWLHRALSTYIAATDHLLASTPAFVSTAPKTTHLPMVVVGAHLAGQPLNSQLTERGAKLLETSRTTREYRLYALANTTPPKPGLVYEPGFDGPGIEVEVWDMPIDAVGSFLALIPPPLSIGSVRLESGQTVKGFLCEGYALGGATEITQMGGWRAYRKQLGS